METGMDILHEVLDEELKKTKPKNTKTIPIKEIIVNKTRDLRIDSRRIKSILDTISNYKTSINKLWTDTAIDSKHRFELSNEIRKSFIEQLVNSDLKYDEVRHLYLQIANAEEGKGVKKEEYKGLSRTIATLLYHSYPNYVNCVLIDTSDSKKTTLVNKKTSGKSVVLYGIKHYLLEKTVCNKYINGSQSL
jgi:hypothetical protein